MALLNINLHSTPRYKVVILFTVLAVTAVFTGLAALASGSVPVPLREVVDILRDNGGRNAYETAALMTWDIRAKSWDDFPIMQRWFATGEAIAHLRWLEDLGELRREDAGERIRYSA